MNCPNGCQQLPRVAIPYLNDTHPQAPQLQNLEIVVCSECGLGAAIPYRSIDEMNDFYARHYRAPGAEQAFVAPPSPIRWPNHRIISQLMLALPHLDRSKTLRILDVGPGGVLVFQTLQALKVACDYTAIEPDQYTANELEKYGAKVFCRAFDPNNIGLQGEFDLILLSHVLEHFSGSTVDNVLQALGSLLQKNGVFIIEVPNAPMLEFGTSRYNDSPHLLFFSKNSLTKLLRRNGFDVAYIGEVNISFADYWKKQQGIRNVVYGNHARSKLKALLNRYCKPIIYFIRMVRNKSQKLRLLLQSGNNIYTVLSGPNFNYGSNCTCLRVLVKKGDVE